MFPSLVFLNSLISTSINVRFTSIMISLNTFLVISSSMQSRSVMAIFFLSVLVMDYLNSHRHAYMEFMRLFMFITYFALISLYLPGIVTVLVIIYSVILPFLGSGRFQILICTLKHMKALIAETF